MTEPSSDHDRPARPGAEPAVEVSPSRRRRAQLRHDAAVVVAEIRRMRRAGRSPTGEAITPRLAA